MAFRSLHGRVVVKCLDRGEKAQGGIIIADTAKEKLQDDEIITGGGDENDKLTPTRCQGRRRRPLRQMVRHRG